MASSEDLAKQKQFEKMAAKLKKEKRKTKGFGEQMWYDLERQKKDQEEKLKAEQKRQEELREQEV